MIKLTAISLGSSNAFPGPLTRNFATLYFLLRFVPCFLALSSELHCIGVLLICLRFLAEYRDLRNFSILIIVRLREGYES